MFLLAPGCPTVLPEPNPSDMNPSQQNALDSGAVGTGLLWGGGACCRIALLQSMHRLRPLLVNSIPHQLHSAQLIPQSCPVSVSSFPEPEPVPKLEPIPESEPVQGPERAVFVVAVLLSCMEAALQPLAVCWRSPVRPEMVREDRFCASQAARDRGPNSIG